MVNDLPIWRWLTSQEDNKCLVNTRLSEFSKKQGTSRWGIKSPLHQLRRHTCVLQMDIKILRTAEMWNIYAICIDVTILIHARCNPPHPLPIKLLDLITPHRSTPRYLPIRMFRWDAQLYSELPGTNTPPARPPHPTTFLHANDWKREQVTQTTDDKHQKCSRPILASLYQDKHWNIL